MVLIVVILILLAVFVVLLLNNDPCTTQITGCIYNKLTNGATVDGDVVHLALFVLVVLSLYQLYRSR